MNLGDLHKVWEIKTLKRKPKEEEARKILDKVAKQVQPIMRKHKWRVKVLSEMCPKNQSLLGLNVGHGIHVKLRLRRPDRDEDFLPFHEVLDTMLHELCHNKISPHNASFYKLWDELRKECEDLINKGVSGSEQGFDLPGKRLGGMPSKPHSSLRQVALTAAENRARLQSLLPSGSNKVGGDSSIMAALSPAQAAAMAAERRFRDNVWCGSEFYDLTGEEDEGIDDHIIPVKSRKDEGIDDHIIPVKSRKRSRGSDGVSLPHSANSEQESTFIDLTETISKNGPSCCSDETDPSKNCRKDYGEASTSSSRSSNEPMHNNVSGTWQCTACTLLNPPLAPVCGVCETQKPKDVNLKTAGWSCRFCTCENDSKVDKCDVCGSWRYSYGPPIASSAPSLGT